MITFLLEKFGQAINHAFPQLLEKPLLVPLEISQSTQKQFGHYQCNSAMKLAKELQLPPREIAKSICEQVERTNADGTVIIENLEIAGAGFINITLSKACIDSVVQQMFEKPNLGMDPPENPQRIIVDFSSPNIAKEMHVGHLRSTIIGDCIARLFEYQGHDVLRLNHLGDWGTAFGMLIAYMKEVAPEVLTAKQSTDLTHLVKWYKESKAKFDTDPEFKKAAQYQVVALQSGDPAALKAWKIICEISEKAYQEIYDLLDVRIEDRGESYYNPILADIVVDLESKGMVQISDGAKCVFLEGFQNREGAPMPLMIQKSDGAYNYDTTDMAAIRQRILEENADRIIYVTDAGQGTHFQLVFKAAEKAGYLDPTVVRVDHVPFGLVLGPDGKKFKTRSGDTERLIDLIYSAIDYARKIIEERQLELPLEEKESLAKALGIGAIKYADLSCNRVGDYSFSYERMLRFEGNTAAFLMYAYVRTVGIKRKVNVQIDDIKGSSKINLEHPSEMALGLHLAQFTEALDQMSNDLLPNRLTDYLYGLAEKFNAFFRDCRVEGTPQQNDRLLLCEITARTLKQGLEILGVKTVERM